MRARSAALSWLAVGGTRQTSSKPGTVTGLPCDIADWCAHRPGAVQSAATRESIELGREAAHSRRRILHAGETWAVPARPNLLLTTGNAGGTDLLVDGVASPSLGASGAVRRDLAQDSPFRLLQLDFAE